MKLQKKKKKLLEPLFLSVYMSTSPTIITKYNRLQNKINMYVLNAKKQQLENRAR